MTPTALPCPTCPAQLQVDEGVFECPRCRFTTLTPSEVRP